MHLAGRGGLVAAEEDRAMGGVKEAAMRGLGTDPGQLLQGEGRPKSLEPVEFGIDQSDQLVPRGHHPRLANRRVGRRRGVERVDQVEVADHVRGEGEEGRTSDDDFPSQEGLGPPLVLVTPVAQRQVMPQGLPGRQEPVDPLGAPAEPPDRPGGLGDQAGDGLLDLASAPLVVIGHGLDGGLGQDGGLVSGTAVQADREEGRAVDQDPLALADGPEVVAEGSEPAIDLVGVLGGEGQAPPGQAVGQAVGAGPGLAGLGPGAGAALRVASIGLELFGRAGHGSRTPVGRSSGGRGPDHSREPRDTIAIPCPPLAGFPGESPTAGRRRTPHQHGNSKLKGFQIS